MKTLKLKTFMLWYFSDENEEGITISDKAIENITNSQFLEVEKLFKSCVFIPCRLIENDINNGGDYNTKELILIK